MNRSFAGAGELLWITAMSVTVMVILTASAQALIQACRLARVERPSPASAVVLVLCCSFGIIPITLGFLRAAQALVKYGGVSPIDARLAALTVSAVLAVPICAGVLALIMNIRFRDGLRVGFWQVVFSTLVLIVALAPFTWLSIW